MLNEQYETIKTLMSYAVPKNKMEKARELLDEFQADPIALNLLQAFYSFLPEGDNDHIKTLLLVARKKGLFLICARTELGDYFYIVNRERAEFLGSCDEGIAEKDTLEFFDLPADGTGLDDPLAFPEYFPARENPNICPVCFAANGELHQLGCPVESCPWCGGQLTYCNCRFEVLNKTELSEEEDLKILEKALEEKGRIPFDPSNERPGYPV
ncbi:MAG: hypothetical protein R6V20_00245 [Desulfobia sp.]